MLSKKRTAVRTRITDLPEIAVELEERQMRIFSGGLTPNLRACVNVSIPDGSTAIPTNRMTDSDWDTDWPKIV
jgi:hypothetical protein